MVQKPFYGTYNVSTENIVDYLFHWKQNYLRYG